MSDLSDTKRAATCPSCGGTQNASRPVDPGRTYPGDDFHGRIPSFDCPDPFHAAHPVSAEGPRWTIASYPDPDGSGERANQIIGPPTPEPVAVVLASELAAAEARAAEIELERDFLLARLQRPNFDWVGISSNEMLAVAITGKRIDGFNTPRDQADLNRCETTYQRAPEHLKPALLPILKGFRTLVAEGVHHSRAPYTREDATRWTEDAIRRAALTPPEQPQEAS